MASFMMKLMCLLLDKMPVFGWSSMNLLQVRQFHNMAASLLPLNPFLRYDKLKIKNIPVLKISLGRKTNNPPVLFIHGGGFFTCSISTHRYLAQRLALRLKTEVYSVEYTLSPESVWPDTVREILDVRDFLIKQNHDHKIFFCGDSAGGNIALSAALELRNKNEILPAGLILFSPITRLRPLNSRLEGLKKTDILLKDIRGDWVGSYVGTTDPSHPGISVANADYHDFPPVFLCAAENELLFEDAKILYDKLVQAGNPVEFNHEKKAFHVFPFFDPFCRESRKSMRAVQRFYDNYVTSSQVGSGMSANGVVATKESGTNHL